MTEINWADYPNFTKSEFNCRHTGKNEMKPEFMKKIQDLRLAYGKPMIITSGYRDPTHPIEAKKKDTRLVNTHSGRVQIFNAYLDLIDIVLFNLRYS